MTLFDISFLPRVLPNSITNAVLPTGRATLGCRGLAPHRNKPPTPTPARSSEKWAPSLGGSFLFFIFYSALSYSE